MMTYQLPTQRILYLRVVIVSTILVVAAGCILSDFLGNDGRMFITWEQLCNISSYRAFGVLLTIILVTVLLYQDRVQEADRNLVRSKDDWGRTFDAVPDLMAIIDQNHRTLCINRAMAERLGISREDAVGRHCYELVHGSQEPPASCPHQKLLDSGISESETLFEQNLNGTFIVTASPLVAENGTVDSSVHVMHDISELKLMENNRLMGTC
jgi:PAS domain S-box-containing protein